MRYGDLSCSGRSEFGTTGRTADTVSLVSVDSRVHSASYVSEAMRKIYHPLHPARSSEDLHLLGMVSIDLSNWVSYRTTIHAKLLTTIIYIPFAINMTPRPGNSSSSTL